MTEKASAATEENGMDEPKQKLKSVAKGVYDAAAKQLLSDRNILADIVHGSIPEAAEMTMEEVRSRISSLEAQGKLKPVALEKTELNVDGSSVHCDVLFEFEIKDGIWVRINVEAQNRADPGYSIAARGMMYSAKLLSEQMTLGICTGSNYDGLRKVYSIWLIVEAPVALAGKIFRHQMATTLIHGDGTEEPRPVDTGADKICVMQVYLPHPESDVMAPEWVKMMGVLLNSDATEDQRRQALTDNGIPITKMMEEELKIMGSLKQGLKEKFEARGEIRGEAKAMARADAQRNESMWKLWKQGICSKEQLQDAFGLSASAVDAILAQQPTVEPRPAL